MRIAILLPDLRPGGVERMRLHLLREWMHEGIEVELVLCVKRGTLLDLVPEGVQVSDLRSLRMRGALRSIVRYLHERRPDVLLVAMWPLTVVALIAAKLARYSGKVVVSDHIAFSLSPQTASLVRRLIFKATVRTTYPWAYNRIGVSRGVADDLAALSGLPRSMFKVIYNPAGVDAPSEPQALPPTMADRKVKQLLAVGTLKPQKDFATLLHAVSLLRDAVPFHLTILGEGVERPSLEALARSLGVGNQVSLPGSVVDTSKYYAAADVFISSSRFEGFGNVIVEAMCHGIQVVSTDCHSGPREILEDGKFGVLVPVADPHRLAEGITKALGEPVDGAVLRRRAADFQPARIGREYLTAMGLAR